MFHSPLSLWNIVQLLYSYFLFFFFSRTECVFFKCKIELKFKTSSSGVVEMCLCLGNAWGWLIILIQCHQMQPRVLRQLLCQASLFQPMWKQRMGLGGAGLGTFPWGQGVLVARLSANLSSQPPQIFFSFLPFCCGCLSQVTCCPQQRNHWTTLPASGFTFLSL